MEVSIELLLIILDLFMILSWSGQVVVCENLGVNWLPFREFLTIKSNNSRSDYRRSSEVIWTNVDDEDE